MTWIIILSSGFVAYGLLAGATIWGLIVSTRLLGRKASVRNLTYVHESLSIGALLATGVHVVALYLDSFIEFTPREIFVPGASDWRPLATAYGTLTLYGVALVTVSFYVRRRIGAKSWRLLHYGTFGLFASAMIHGIRSGTDAGTPVGLALYVTTGSLVVGLVLVRMLRQRSRRGTVRTAHPEERVVPPAVGTLGSAVDRAL
jgi:predicted ferric reductase